MSARMETAARPSLLEVRRLDIVTGGEGPRTLRSVRCPAVDRAVTLEQCLACPDAGAAPRPLRGRAEHVACRHPLAAVARAALREPAGARAILDRTPVAEVMTGDVLAVRPDVSVETLTGLLLERRIGGAPVVDEHGRPIGIVTGTDLITDRYLAGDTAEDAGVRGGRVGTEGAGVHATALASGSVAEVMTPIAFTIPERTPVSRAAALMTVRGVHRLVVVAEDGRVSGVVTTTDVVRWLARRGGFLARELRAAVAARRRRRRRAAHAARAP